MSIGADVIFCHGKETLRFLRKNLPADYAMRLHDLTYSGCPALDSLHMRSKYCSLHQAIKDDDFCSVHIANNDTAHLRRHCPKANVAALAIWVMQNTHLIKGYRP